MEEAVNGGPFRVLRFVLHETPRTVLQKPRLVANVCCGSLSAAECIKQPGAAYGQKQPLEQLSFLPALPEVITNDSPHAIISFSDSHYLRGELIVFV